MEVICLLCYCDREQICRFANQQFCNWFGKASYELVNIVSLKNLLQTDYFRHELFLNKVLDGTIQTNVHEMQSFSGDVLKVTTMYYPDLYNGKVLGFFLHITNMNIPLASKNIDSGYNELLGRLFSNMAAGDDKMYQIAEQLKKLLFSDFPSIEDLARQHLISVSKLMRDFKRVFDLSPFQYYRKLQMDFAKRHFRETACNKKQMALLLGFSNPANFASCYSKHIENQLTEQNLINNETDISKILTEQISVSVAIFDRDMIYLAASNQWIKDFNLTGVEVIGESLFVFFPDKRERWIAIESRALQGEIIKSEADYFIKPDGKRYWFKWEIKPWFNARGEIGGVIICVSALKSKYIMNINSQILNTHRFAKRVEFNKFDLSNITLAYNVIFVLSNCILIYYLNL